MHQMKGDPHYLFELFVRLYRMVFLMEVTSEGYRYVAVSDQAKVASSLPNDAIGRHLHEMYPAEVADELVWHYDEVVRQREPVYFMSQMNIESNTARFASSMLFPLEDEAGQIRYIFSLTTDLSEEAELKLLRSIEHIDYLTGMPNLMKVKLELEKVLEASEDVATSVLRLHLNRFQMTTSLQGVEWSSRILKEVTRQLADVLPSGSIVGRVDGEDFIIVLPNTAQSEATCHATQVLELISTHAFHMAESTFALSGYIGISTGTSDAERLLLNASTALLEARQDGKQPIRHYEHDDFVQRYVDEMTIEAELATGLGRDELSVVYQPKVTREGHVHFEALVRWTNPVLGPVSPDRFIPIAEKSRLIQDVTDFVVRRVCEDVQAHPERFAERRVAINISTVLFQLDAMKRVEETIHAHGLTPSQFELEVTEHTLMTEPTAAIKTVDYLKQSGFRLLIDDFGVSYSSLNYLKLFDIDGIKIDRSFIGQLDASGESKEYEIVNLIIGLAKKLKLDVTAEGVETIEQYRILETLGCDDVQGYLFSRPVTLDAIQQTLELISLQLETLHQSFSLQRGGSAEETARLQAILALDVLDTPEEERYDRITRLVTKTLDLPIAFISFVTNDEQWFKSCQGITLESRRVDRDWTLCQHVITARTPLVVEDVSAQTLMPHNDWLGQIGFYAGVPLVTRHGHVVGTLCVTDYEPRSFDASSLQILQDFAYWVMAELERQT